MPKPKYKKELIITENFNGILEYGNSGMKHEEELEIFSLHPGDKVFIYRKLKK